MDLSDWDIINSLHGLMKSIKGFSDIKNQCIF